MKKINGNAADIIKAMIHEGETIIEINGKKYYLSLIEDPGTTVTEDVLDNSDLKQKLLQAKMDILKGNIFSTDEILEMIEQGEL